MHVDLATATALMKIPFHDAACKIGGPKSMFLETGRRENASASGLAVTDDLPLAVLLQIIHPGGERLEGNVERACDVLCGPFALSADIQEDRPAFEAFGGTGGGVLGHRPCDEEPPEIHEEHERKDRIQKYLADCHTVRQKNESLS